MFLSAVILSILSAKLFGGRLSRFGQVTVRALPIAVLALACQRFVREAGWRGWPLPDIAAPMLFALGYLLLFRALVSNRQLPGMGWIAAGSAMNFVAIFANGGRMPVTLAALQTVGLGPSAVDPASNLSHQLFQPGMRFGWLVDFIPLKLPFQSPSVASLGDVAMCVGIFLFVFSTTGAAGMHAQGSGATHPAASA